MWHLSLPSPDTDSSRPAAYYSLSSTSKECKEEPEAAAPRRRDAGEHSLAQKWHRHEIFFLDQLVLRLLLLAPYAPWRRKEGPKG